MKITKLKRISYIYIETDQDEYNCYRRDVNSKTWEVSVGESWEYCGADSKLEELVYAQRSGSIYSESGTWVLRLTDASKIVYDAINAISDYDGIIDNGLHTWRITGRDKDYIKDLVKKLQGIDIESLL